MICLARAAAHLHEPLAAPDVIFCLSCLLRILTRYQKWKEMWWLQ